MRLAEWDVKENFYTAFNGTALYHTSHGDAFMFVRYQLDALDASDRLVIANNLPVSH